MGSRASLLPCCLFSHRVRALTQRPLGREDGKTSGRQEGKPAQDTSPEGSVPPSLAQGPLCTPVRAPTTCLVPSTFLLPASSPHTGSHCGADSGENLMLQPPGCRGEGAWTPAPCAAGGGIQTARVRRSRGSSCLLPSPWLSPRLGVFQNRLTSASVSWFTRYGKDTFMGD